MTVLCPCCGQSVNADKAPIEALEAAPLATVPRTIVNALVKSYPRAISAEFLVERIYSGAREPADARGTLAVQIVFLRKKLTPYGWTIPKGVGGRGNRAFYKLEPLP